jgi:lipoyl(octanoyl) transferase
MSIVSEQIDCHLRVDAPAPGPWNMAVDEALLADAADSNVATLRFYQWDEPTLSLGYFQRYDDRLAHAASACCAIVRRPSGGGAILHDRELTYSLTLPHSHPLTSQADRVYRSVHESFIAVLQPRTARTTPPVRLEILGADCHAKAAQEPFLCFERRARGDVALQTGEIMGATAPRNRSSAAGCKVLGSAQRRHRRAVLQHGSLLLGTSPVAPELPGLSDLTGTDIPIVELIDPLSRQLAEALGLRLFCSPEPSDRLESTSRRLANTKYGHESWTKRR